MAMTDRTINLKDAADIVRMECGAWTGLAETIVRRFKKLSPVDAVPVRRGRWKTDGMMMDDGEYLMTRCTACGEAYEYGYNMPFCPNCGADMREDGEKYGE